MAEERIPPIVVSLEYEYKNAGIKQMSADMNKIGTGKGITDARKGFKALSAEFAKMSGTFSMESDKVVSAYNKIIAQQKKVAQADANYKEIVKQKSEIDRNYAIKREKLQVKLEEAQQRRDKKAEKLNKATAALAEARAKSKRVDSDPKVLSASDKVSAAQNELEIADKKVGIIEAEQQLAEKKRAEQIKNINALKKQGVAEVREETEKYKVAIENALIAEDKYREEQRVAKINQIKDAWKNLGDTVKKIPQKFKQGIQSFAATIYVLRRVTNFIKNIYKEITNLISASSKWVENLNLLEVVFGDVSYNAKTTKDWVSDLARTFSMDKNAIVQYVSTFKQMANAMGQVSETGEKMSKVLTQLGLDISSLRNVKTETAMSDLASAIAGQIKPVRKYGFDITQQSIAALLKETGIGGTTATMSQADKQLARTILLIRQSKDAWGDLAKTINTFANQERILNDQFETTKRLIGQVFLGTFQFGQKLDEAKETAGVATQIIWHLNSVVIAFNDVLEAILPTADNVNGAISALAEDTQDDIEETEEALESSLASFDKFNVLSSGQNGAQTGTSATLEGVFNKEAAQYIEDFDKRSKDIVSYARELADILLRKLFPDFDKWAGNSKKTFKDWVTDVNGAKNSILAMIEPITSLANTIKDIIIKGIEDIPNILAASSNLLNGIARFVQPILKLVADILTKLGPDGVQKALKAILIIVLTIKATQILVGTITGIANVVKSLQVLLPLIGKVAAQAKAAIAAGSGATITALSVSISMLVAGIGIFIALKDKMTSTARAITIALAALLSVLTGIIVAMVSMKSMHLTPVVAIGRGLAAGAAVAGGVLALGATFSAIANKHAQGGYQTGGLFYAGESGAEWVGRQGNTSTIVNDKQMSDIMQQSVAMGVIQGNRMAGGASGNGSNKVAVVNLDGRKLFEVVQENGKRVGKVFAEA